ncbi:hypothetical protein V490_02718 [Pseudogymnoascus sp. VKM F-3557]|nr:hypothetical protein V490_02718 [Pseudogymnoascus sp. VKM F-3557]
MATQPNDPDAAKPIRSRRAFRKRLLCRDDVLNMSERAGEEPVHPEDYSTSFAEDSTCHQTWGILDSGPTHAISKPRRYRGLNARKESARLRRTEKSKPAHKPAYPLLTSLPMELREIVYGYLLLNNGPIILHTDWCEVQRNATLDVGILRVCKMIYEEATRFMYQRNVFHALVRDSGALSRFDQCILPPYVHLFRNLVIENTKESWGLKWMRITATSIQTLIESEVSLDSLTLVFAPKTLTADIVAGKTEDMAKLASALAEKSGILKQLVRIRCKVINLVIKLEGRKLVVSLDIRHLRCDYSTSVFDDQGTKQGRRVRARKARKDLSGLKRVVERIRDNWERAVRLGVCRVMGEDEKISDGLALKRV